MPTDERLSLLLDEESAEEQDLEIAPQDPLGFRDSKRYADRLIALQKHTGQPDAFRSFLAKLDGVPVSFGMFQFEFMGGSMGSVVGERSPASSNEPLRSEFLRWCCPHRVEPACKRESCR